MEKRHCCGPMPHWGFKGLRERDTSLFDDLVFYGIYGGAVVVSFTGIVLCAAARFLVIFQNRDLPLPFLKL